MAWHITDDLAAFDAAALGLLKQQPTQNTVLLSVPGVLRERGPNAFGSETPRFGWYEEPDGTVSGAFVHTPPHPLLLSHVPAEAVPALAEALLASPCPLAGVNGQREQAQAVAQAWCAAKGTDAVLERTHRLYLLGQLIEPEPAPAGAARSATADDLDLLLDWFVEFTAEVGDPVINAQRAVVDRLDYGGLTLWELDGVPVSMAGITRQLEGGGIRVGPVYTPKPSRGHGYAAAATAAVCRLAFERGAQEVSLYADVANPTSNSLYQRLGFRSLGERVVIRFEG
ncbi:GNAT family N-acetyltransferase [Actinocrinis puniceicyclus]|uniref:GNAT family N-acetyltransferase n=1 Tax=Actinocrinis puniceicyclus TaxID=977794 RepID=A0A8J8BAN2_9ACTN|nr:GNAT family N-acetyltransferase [Actinocrinis puniceicyclus]MBS2963142.1 GNAT family N-acetyltransferase [Actinocrinis puniceicyclus]